MTKAVLSKQSAKDLWLSTGACSNDGRGDGRPCELDDDHSGPTPEAEAAATSTTMTSCRTAGLRSEPFLLGRRLRSRACTVFPFFVAKYSEPTVVCVCVCVFFVLA
mmetsp:Transcript_63626/g.207583  ORF Transcript_63626/g.207583 Transcript_63626/m.207583 type:complete len:106 (+) Transcript_63626:935-1252(+)